MLTRFAVKNYRGFKERIVWDLSTPSNYSFNTDAIKDGVVKNGIIYGPNGSGKTNLSMALFDLVNHLTQKFKKPDYYRNFIYTGRQDNLVEFEYTLNGKKEKFISFISDCDNSFTSIEYLDIPLVKKEISQAHSVVSIVNTIVMGLSLIIGIISLWKAFKSFEPLISLPYIIAYFILLILTINVALIGIRSELSNPIKYTYFKNNIPKMYIMLGIGIVIFVIMFMFGIEILFNFI